MVRVQQKKKKSKKGKGKRSGGEAGTLKKSKKQKGDLGATKTIDKAAKTRKAIRFKPGTVRRREIKKSQKKITLCLPRLPFVRVVRECVQDYDPHMRIQKKALDDLQRAAECHVIRVAKKCGLASVHAKRVTLYPKDIMFVHTIEQM